MTNAVEIQGLTKRYKGKSEKLALKGIDLTIPKGSFFGLLGPNGAGKSTMINIMAGLVVKTGGHVAIAGHDIDKSTRAARMALGVVPQELIVDTFFTVREALDIHAGYYGVPKSARRTQEIIDALGLSEQADMHSRKLSGGMRRRLLVGKALVHAPEVLVLDEPTAGVDVELREQLWHYVRELHARGTTILLTTHYLEEAEELCDQIAIINHGEVVACDSKNALMQQMDSKVIAFIFEGILAEVPEGLRHLKAAVNDNRLSVRFKPSEMRIGTIIDAVRNHTSGLLDIVTEEPELEDVFRQITSK